MSDLTLAYQLDSSVIAAAAPDEELGWVRRAQAGDLRAFDAIMGQYEARLLRFLIGLVSDAEVARELCQDTFLAAYQALPRMSGDVRLCAWLHTIALNRARSYHRRRRLRLFLPLDDDHPALQQRDVQEAVASHDLVRTVLERMPDRYSHPLLLQVAGGLSCREIADVIGCSEGAVKVRLLRARESFRKIYAEEERQQCAR